MVTLFAPQYRNRVPPITILIPRSGGSAASFGSAFVKPKSRPPCTSSAQVWGPGYAKVGFCFDGGVLTADQFERIRLDPQEHAGAGQIVEAGGRAGWLT